MMSRTKALRILAILTMGFVGVICMPLVSAQSTVVNVMLGPPPVDVCPNISGLQAAVPNGMVVDTNGDCITPAPPPVDVCGNITGLQITIPNGYYQDTNGDCLVQPAPPVDVCPNIFGLQVIVPSSLIVDTDGNCVTPPIDECPNITGAQSTIPDGMVFKDGACSTPPGTISPPDYTPPTTTPQTTTPTPPAQSSNFWNYTGPDYKNVPELLNPVVDTVVNAIPEPVKEALKTVPPSVARTVPYYISGGVGMVAGIVTVQIVQELFAARALMGFLRRDKNIADQKDNFIALASHYLRTPLTLMRNGLDTIVALKELPAESVMPLMNIVKQLDSSIKSILADVENNEALTSIKSPDMDTRQPHVLKSPFFWIPFLIAALLSLTANFLLGVVADVELGTFNMVLQVIVFVAVGSLLYSAVRNIYIKRRHRKHQQQLVEHEHAIDEARNAFIERSTAVLEKGLTDLYNSHGSIEHAQSARFFDEGYTRFSEILRKFLLLSQIQTGSMRNVSTINLHSVVDEAIDFYKPLIQEKQLTITNEIDDSISVEQNKALFGFVLQSLIDNAVKFNSNGGTIAITAHPLQRVIRIKVADSGIGIPKDKLPQLFKPFSRADSAIEFNYEGLGFSLFLDKIITDYMGGSIRAAAPEKGGTAITVTAHLAHSK